MTLLVRDEADIVDSQIAFHLHAGVDFVVAMDNGSQDGTTEVLERYAQAGYAHVMREPGDVMWQAEWVTNLARLAATEFGADWVINSDADEFWWPRAGSLKETLATVPARYGVVRGCWRHFVPRLDDGAFFAERMTVRLRAPANPADKATVFHAHQKVAHRAHPNVVIEDGNHNAYAPGLDPIRAWHPLEVLHFSFRSVAQLEQKAQGGWVRNPIREPTLHVRRLDEAFREHRLQEFYDSFAVRDDALKQGLADGRLTMDTRLRNALRELSAPDDEGGGFVLPDAGRRLAFARPALGEDAIYADEASVLAEIDGVVRAEQRVEALEERLATLEREPLSRLQAKLADRARGSG